MERSDRIAELEQLIKEITEWRSAWAAGQGSRDVTEFHRRGEVIAADQQELDLLKDANAKGS